MKTRYVLMRPLFFCLICTVSGNVLYAQSAFDYSKYIKGINKDKMSYDYMLTLVDNNTHKIQDSLRGKIYKIPSGYLDSNLHYLNVKDNDYALQIRFDKQDAYVKSIKDIESRLKKDVDHEQNVFMNLNDLLKKNLVSSSVSVLPEGGTKITILFKDAQFTGMDVYWDKERTLKKIVLRMVASYDPSADLSREMVMEHFSDNFSDELVRSSRFLVLADRKYKLKGSYSRYSVREIVYK